MNVTIETLPELRVAAVRHVGPYHDIGEAFQRLDGFVRAAGLVAQPDTFLIGVYLDDPQTRPAAELRSDAGITISPQAPLPAGLTETRLPAGRYARTTYVGHYAGLPDVWARLWREWLPASGQRPAARPSFEIYRNTPMDTRPEDLITDVYLPLA
jgi:AraC family transcriptional regulator